MCAYASQNVTMLHLITFFFTAELIQKSKLQTLEVLLRPNHKPCPENVAFPGSVFNPSNHASPFHFWLSFKSRISLLILREQLFFCFWTRFIAEYLLFEGLELDFFLCF